MNCPLCTAAANEFTRDKRRVYMRCNSCSLVFVPAGQHCSIKQEQERYALHDNSDGNEGYVRFLEQTAAVVDATVPAGASVLDFGCGENAVLSEILRKRGYRCRSWDPLYEQHAVMPGEPQSYDLVLLNEVIEHCRDSRATVGIIGKHLTGNGKVLLRTQCYPVAAEVFRRWWYIQDPTHIAFFSEKALATVAVMLGLALRKTHYPDIYILS